MILASLLGQTEHFTESYEVLQRGREQEPTSALLLSSEAMVRIIQDDVAGTLAILERLERRQDFSAHARSLRIRCLLLSGKLDEALGRLESDIILSQATEDAAHEDLSRYWLAQLLNLRGRHEAAAQQARMLSERASLPYNLFSLRAAAEAAYEAGSAGILTTVVQKLRIVSLQYPSTRSRGFLLQAEALEAALGRRNVEAKALILRSYELWPDITAAFFLAQIYWMGADFAQALPLYEAVIAKKGTAVRWEPQTLWVRSLAQAGRCLTALGRTSEALDRYNGFLRRWGAQTNVPLVQEILGESQGKRR
jgi:tetratricopeptide (TPR) repeat protein